MRRFGVLSAWKCATLVALCLLLAACASRGLTTPSGSGVGQVPASAVHLDSPWSMAIGGNFLVLVEDAGLQKAPVLRVVNLTSERLETIALPGEAFAFRNVAASPDGTFVITSRDAVHRFDPATRRLSPWIEDSPDPNRALAGAILGDVIVDHLGRLYASVDGRIVRVDPAADTAVRIAGVPDLKPYDARFVSGDGGPATQAGLGWTRDLAIDANGNLFVSQTSEYSNGDRVRRVDGLMGTVATVIGPAHRADGETDAHSPAQRIRPEALAFEPDGRLLVVDRGQRLLRLTLDSGNIEVVAGAIASTPIPSSEGSPPAVGDGGPARDARFIYVSDVAVDNSGNVYLLDLMGRRVRRIDRRTGVIRTVVGNSGLIWPESTIHGDDRQASDRPEIEVCTNTPEPAGLVVRAFDELDNMIPGVNVVVSTGPLFELAIARATTDAIGSASFEVAGQARYRVDARMPGFVEQVVSLRLSPDCTAYLNLKLKPKQL